MHLESVLFGAILFLLMLENVIVCTQPICPTAPMETADEDHPRPSCSGTTAAPPIDPAQWPPQMSDAVRMDLVSRGPVQVDRDFEFPRSHINRSFHTTTSLEILQMVRKLDVRG